MIKFFLQRYGFQKVKKIPYTWYFANGLQLLSLRCICCIIKLLRRCAASEKILINDDCAALGGMVTLYAEFRSTRKSVEAKKNEADPPSKIH
jgi:hypothetical protein